MIRVKTPNGDAFYRYNHDGYGEMDDGRRWNFDGKYTGKGRLWALLSGERGQYEIALSNLGKTKVENIDPKESQAKAKEQYDWKVVEIMKKNEAYLRLEAMVKFANDGLMIPEQIWDSPDIPKNIDKQFVPELKFGEGTGSATPLAWSMAQFIRLAVNLKEGRNLDTPDVVYNRYVLGNNKRETDSAITRTIENRQIIGEPQVKFGDYKKSPSQNNVNQNVSGEKSIINNQKSLEEVNKKVDITTSCYSDWSDKNREKVLKQSPIILDCKEGIYLPIFVYSGKGENVEVVGDFTGWKPQKLTLTRYQPYAPVEGDFLEFSRFYALENIDKSARVEYKLIVDGKWITDPLNPNKVDNGVGGENSVFTMPDYQPTKWLQFYIDGWRNNQKISLILRAHMKRLTLTAKIYGKPALIKVHNPGDYDILNESRFFYLFALFCKTEQIILIEQKQLLIQQKSGQSQAKSNRFIMVFLDPKDRMKEYWANDDYAKYFATEVVPAIDKRIYQTIKNRDGRAIIGSEFGRNYEHSRGTKISRCLRTRWRAKFEFVLG